MELADNQGLWGRKVKLTVDHTKVTGDETDAQIPLIWNGTNGNIPAEVYNAGATSPLSDGGDIRFSSDEAGTVELPMEIVTFTPNATVGSARVEIWVKLASISSANNTDFYMWWNNATAARYTYIDTYGRNAVWQNYFVAVYHMNEGDAEDATGTSHTGTNYGTDDTTTALGTARLFVMSSRDYIKVVGLMGNNTTVSIFALVDNTDIDTNGAEVISLGDHVVIRLLASAANECFYYTGSGYYYTTNNVSVQDQGLCSLHYICSPPGSTQRFYTNGGGVGTTTHNTAISYAGLGANTYIGRHGNGDTNKDYGGKIDELRISSVDKGTTHPVFEYNSTIGFATFLSPGDPYSTGGWFLLSNRNNLYNTMQLTGGMR
jgi:hypothetical protein